MTSTTSSGGELPLEAVLAGDLAMKCWRPTFNHDAIVQLCRELRAPSSQSAWAPTPWGRTLPRSCVGTDPSSYLSSLALLRTPAVQELDRLFFAPATALLSKTFSRPMLALRLANGQVLPGWALREMASGEGIPFHCEQDWNRVNLIENGTLMETDFEPNFQMSFLYSVETASSGGELQISGHDDLVTLNTGELLLFNAGCHRHQIRSTGGPCQRVVLGGFLRLNLNHTSLHCYV